MLNVEPTLAATNKLIACLQKSGRGFVILNSCFQGFFVVVVVVVFGRDIYAL